MLRYRGYYSYSFYRYSKKGKRGPMKTFLIVFLSIVGFLGLVLGGLVVLWFYQGGCCIRRIKAKITKKDYVAPVLRSN